jgi:hypothetical protein
VGPRGLPDRPAPARPAGTAIGHPVGLRDYLTLAWIISSMATVGGAIRSGLEDEEDVRAAAYGYHPTPGGWRDGQDEEPDGR